MYASLDHRFSDFKNEGCINQTDPWRSLELCPQSFGQPAFFFFTRSLLIVFSPLCFSYVPQLTSWTCKKKQQKKHQQQPSISITLNKILVLILFFITVYGVRQTALCIGTGGNHNAPHVSMHIHASPQHRVTATTLQRDRGDVEKGVGGWMKWVWGGGWRGQKSKSGFQYFHLFPFLQNCLKWCTNWELNKVCTMFQKWKKSPIFSIRGEVWTGDPPPDCEQNQGAVLYNITIFSPLLVRINSDISSSDLLVVDQKTTGYYRQ